MKNLQKLICASACFMLGIPAAYAGVLSYFTADGVTESVAQQGSALFDFSSPGLLTITLTDNVSPTANIASELNGLQFSLTAAPTSGTLQSVSAQSVIDCTNAVSPCPSGTGSTPYGWGTTLNGTDFVLGAGFNQGVFGYQPYGIVNQSYSADGNGGLSSAANNPLLVGPVSFTFALTGLDFIPEVSSVTFLFGTVPNAQIGVDPPVPVPEPQSLALVGLGLLAAFGVVHLRGKPART